MEISGPRSSWADNPPWLLIPHHRQPFQSSLPCNRLILQHGVIIIIFGIPERFSDSSFPQVQFVLSPPGNDFGWYLYAFDSSTVALHKIHSPQSKDISWVTHCCCLVPIPHYTYPPLHSTPTELQSACLSMYPRDKIATSACSIPSLQWGFIIIKAWHDTREGGAASADGKIEFTRMELDFIQVIIIIISNVKITELNTDCAQWSSWG